MIKVDGMRIFVGDVVNVECTLGTYLLLRVDEFFLRDDICKTLGRACYSTDQRDRRHIPSRDRDLSIQCAFHSPSLPTFSF